MTQNELRGSTTKLSKIKLTARSKRTEASRERDANCHWFTATFQQQLGPLEKPINQVESRILPACYDLSTGRKRTKKFALFCRRSPQKLARDRDSICRSDLL